MIWIPHPCLVFNCCLFVLYVGNADSSTVQRLLIRLVKSVEEVKHTHKIHSSLLQNILRQLNGVDVDSNELPEGLSFPMQTTDDVTRTEDKLSSSATKKLLVSNNIHYIIVQVL
jgi:hypothetical protein